LYSLEGLQGVLENKETWSFVSREQGIFGIKNNIIYLENKGEKKRNFQVIKTKFKSPETVFETVFVW